MDSIPKPSKHWIEKTDKQRKYVAEYRKKNRDKIIARQKEWFLKKLETDPNFCYRAYQKTK